MAEHFVIEEVEEFEDFDEFKEKLDELVKEAEIQEELREKEKEE